MIDAHIIKKGAYCLTTQLDEKQEKYIQSTFTIRNKNIMGYFDIIKCYCYKKANGQSCILMPRFAPLYLKKLKFKCHNDIPEGTKKEYTLLAKFCGNQELVYNEIFANYFNKTNLKLGLCGTIVNLEAGQGKTFLALHVIKRLGQKTFIVVHNELILNQWVKVITDNMPNVKIGQWYGKKKFDGDIIIGIINSAFEYEKWLDVGLCIFDEAHLYSSKKRAEIFKICQATYMLGLSATPDDKKEKQDNTYKIIQWEIGPILDAAKLNNYVGTNITFTGNVKMIKYYGPEQYTQTHINETLGVVSNPKMIQQLTEDPYRTNLIVRETLELITDPTINLFIFANRRSYLQHIQEKLILALNPQIHPIILDEDTAQNYISTIMGQSLAEDVEKAERHSKIILTTYQYFGTGKSIPRMNSMILATPFKTGSKQYINRIFRLGSDNTIARKIIDIVDWGTTLKSQWYSRKKYYIAKEYSIDVVEAKWNEI